MVRPLTKCRRDGVRYGRPPAIETEIEVALQEDPATLRERLLITDKASPDHLSSECLVHLIRDALCRRDDQRLNRALPVLLGRCEAILRTKIANSLQGADELREEVLSELSELLASDGTGERPDDLDFYECRFNAAFRVLRIEAVRRELKRLERTAEPLGPGGECAAHAHDEDAFARLFESSRTREAINALPPDERKALVLHHEYGYKVESTDPDEATVATLCQCTGRTIRNRLARAATRLAELKENV